MNLPQTEYAHWLGDIVTLNENLTAIGGVATRKIEVYDGGIWNETKIPSMTPFF